MSDALTLANEALLLAAQKIAHMKHLAGVPDLQCEEEWMLQCACWVARSDRVAKWTCVRCEKPFFSWCVDASKVAGERHCLDCIGPAMAEREKDAVNGGNE
ncbi:hypothetical protein LCGC14_0983270 [marine sediment metagenome]|uniref:Uncharacterized protein n=1 Tax=marine sediment metagenome TaxID=412755 RepID=A0A0F9REI1_9ZZZZ